MVRLRSPAPYGGIPERPKGADCKSVVFDFAGPNPASPTKKNEASLWCLVLFCEVADSNQFRFVFTERNAGSYARHRHRGAGSPVARRGIFALGECPASLPTYHSCGGLFFALQWHIITLQRVSHQLHWSCISSLVRVYFPAV